MGKFPVELVVWESERSVLFLLKVTGDFLKIVYIREAVMYLKICSLYIDDTVPQHFSNRSWLPTILFGLVLGY